MDTHVIFNLRVITVFFVESIARTENGIMDYLTGGKLKKKYTLAKASK